AEIITEGFFASRAFVIQAPSELRRLAQDRIEEWHDQNARLAQRLHRQHPRRWLQEQSQRLDDLQSTLTRCVSYSLRASQANSLTLTRRLWRVKPSQLRARRGEVVLDLSAGLQASARRCLQLASQRLITTAAKLRLLSPLNILERGYSITQDAATGRVLQS